MRARDWFGETIPLCKHSCRAWVNSSCIASDSNPAKTVTSSCGIPSIHPQHYSVFAINWKCGEEDYAHVLSSPSLVSRVRVMRDRNKRSCSEECHTVYERRPGSSSRNVPKIDQQPQISAEVINQRAAAVDLHVFSGNFPGVRDDVTLPSAPRFIRKDPGLSQQLDLICFRRASIIASIHPYA